MIRIGLLIPLLVLPFAHCSSDGGALADGGTDGATTDGKGDGNTTSDASKDALTDASGDAKGDAPNGNAAGVNLATAGDYVMLAKTGVSNVPMSAVTGNVGVSPAAASYLTGFSLTADSTNTFATSPQVTGKLYASDYTPPTPSNLTTAIGDMQLAFTDAAGRAPDVTELGAGNIGGMTLSRGVYKWGSGLLVPTNLTLDGAATDVWIFQVAQDLNVSSGTQIILSGGASAKNVFWEVAGAVVLETTVQFQGIVLCQTEIALKTGASIHGRLLAQSAITIEGSTVVAP